MALLAHRVISYRHNSQVHYENVRMVRPRCSGGVLGEVEKVCVVLRSPVSPECVWLCANICLLKHILHTSERMLQTLFEHWGAVRRCMCWIMYVCIWICALLHIDILSVFCVHTCVGTCILVTAGLVHFATEELQANDGIDNDDEKDQQGDMEQRNHGFDYGVQHYL